MDAARCCYGQVPLFVLFVCLETEWVPLKYEYNILLYIILTKYTENILFKLISVNISLLIKNFILKKTKEIR